MGRWAPFAVLEAGASPDCAPVLPARALGSEEKSWGRLGPRGFGPQGPSRSGSEVRGKRMSWGGLQGDPEGL